jgi:hypothetical protein
LVLGEWVEAGVEMEIGPEPGVEMGIGLGPGVEAGIGFEGSGLLATDVAVVEAEAEAEVEVGVELVEADQHLGCQIAENLGQGWQEQSVCPTETSL